ncbi:tetratricopeptide repeat protein [Motiliproteus sp. SC1-56]|uniref:tetratricopeptide repeat protein n=1 Tax=Motiliproteus sp. SC1-56 TaxID=2799565 RepID=UPI001A8FEAE1|nr:EH signature domain-containing protein [Motiliproteus sp. SC1-56]
MQRLAKGIEEKPWKAGLDISTFPPKTVSEILLLLDSGQDELISILDWVHLLDHKAAWDAVHSDQDIARTSAKIFRAIAKDNSLTQLALFRAALTIDGSGTLFPPILLEHLHLLSDSVLGRQKELLDIVLHSKHEDFLAIAGLVATADLSVEEFFSRYRLPRCTRLKQETMNSLPRLFEELDLSSRAGWCLYMLKETDRSLSVAMLEVLLSKRQGDVQKVPYVLEWLDENCHPRHDEGYWFELSESSHSALRELITISDFHYFRKLVDLLRDSTISNALRLDEHGLKQIKSRSLFWAHYESRILSLRILVPGDTYQKLPMFIQTADWLERFEEQGGSEAVVFEFEHVLILEVLRDVASEIRVFLKNTRNVNLLLRSNPASLERFRNAHQDGVHDHAVCWQWACEQWLRTNYKILPDDRVTRFRGLPPAASSYSRLHGLPAPDGDMLDRRSDELEYWSASFYAREQSLGKHGAELDRAHGQTFSLKGINHRERGRKDEYKRCLSKASELGDRYAADELCQPLIEEAKAFGRRRNIAKMRALLEKAAGQGSAEAMVALALASSQTEYDRRQGDEWLKKAARLGHPKARRILRMD